MSCQGSYGRSTASSRSRAFSVMRTFEACFSVRLIRKSRCALSLSRGLRRSRLTPWTDHWRCSRSRAFSRSRFDVSLVSLGRVAPGGLARLEVGREPAGVTRRPMARLVDLDHRRHDPLKKRTVVRHHDQPAGPRLQERLEPVEAVEVEVVRWLVEQEQVETGEQQTCQGRLGALPS